MKKYTEKQFQEVKAATLLHKHESYVRKGLREGRPGFEYGSAVKTSGKWS